LQGDLNELQQLALASVIKQREDKEYERDWRQFVMTAVAMHPENTKSILTLLDPEKMSEEEKEQSEYAKPLTDEEMEEYIPVQMRPEHRDIITDLRELGIVVLDD